LPEDHDAWRRTGEAVMQMSNILGLMLGAELVVPCGGIGSGAQDEYGPHLNDLLEVYASRGSATQILLKPQIIPVPKADRQVFELFGGEGVMRDVYTRIS
jgi:hypothetical protein